MNTRTLFPRDSNLEDPSVQGISRLPARATVVPAQRKDIFYRGKEASSLLLSLNGSCRFAYRGEDDIPDFSDPAFSDDAWDTVPIPSMWQYLGYGKPRYPNVRYCFPFDPPYIRKENPVGYYRRHFTLDTVPAHTILHFGGVDNAFYVYINGVCAGFSKGSRMAAEFDVTALVKPGDNLLAVKVFTYSDASYLEDQDMLLTNGIFRDVFLFTLDTVYLFDYRVTTTRNTVTVHTVLHGDTEQAKVLLSLEGTDAEGVITGAEGSYTFTLDDPRLWNAEEPNLYTLYMTICSGDRVCEIHSKRIGILWSYVKGNQFFVNDRPVMIKGVNRHENNAKTGKALTVADMEHDLRHIKANHLNAIRTSHYPNDPAMYEIASEIGLYILDEGDIETHGCGDATGDQGYLSKNPAWRDAYVDRTTRIFEANKNEVCIFMRSVGNECGTGENLNLCSRLLQEWDPSRTAIQYGSPVVRPDSASFTNFRGIGYYPMSRVTNMPAEGAPVLAIEYAHAMGNSPGTLSDYWDYNYTHEKMAGGFVWEYRSHGFYQEDEKGCPFYQYGGDFDDTYHWSNFTLDGYCMSDGTPKPSWKELGTVLFPAYVRMENGVLSVRNTNDFTTLDRYSAALAVKRDGVVIGTLPLALPLLQPRETFSCPVPALPEEPVPGAEYDLDVIFSEGGREVQRRQFRLPVHTAAIPAQRNVVKYKTAVCGDRFAVTGDGFSCAFDSHGMLCSYVKDGTERLAGPMKCNFYRAPTDNDGIVGLFPRYISVWNNAFLGHLNFSASDISAKEAESGITVTVRGKTCADSITAGFDLTVVYEILADGVLFVRIEGTPFGRIPDILPRIGVMIPLKKSFDSVYWLGRGEGESYPDEKAAAPVGRYALPITAMNTFYDVPQENGNREDTRFVILSDGENRFTAAAKDAFSFSFHNFTLENLTKARHRNELEFSDIHYLYLDYRMRGLGSHSCGPDPEPQYELYAHAFRFCFTLSCADEAQAETLIRTDFGVGTRPLSGKYHFDPAAKKEEFLACDIE